MASTMAEPVYVVFAAHQYGFVTTKGSSHGPMFLGTAFNVLLYGISITQTYLYLISFKK
jgi:hypothetical protein